MTQLSVLFAKPMFGAGEERQINEAIHDLFEGVRSRDPEGHQITNAGRVIEFEERFAEYVGGGVAVAVSSCMAALHLCLLAMGIGRGSRVVVPALTHLAMANAVELVGAECVFVDSHPESGNLDPDLIPEDVDLISLVHFLGRPGYMKSLLDISRRTGAPILEDCALALGTVHQGSGKHVGLIGKAGCFSFYPAKHMTTGEGGMVLTTDAEFADKVRKLRSFGYGADRSSGVEFPGLNYRMTEFQAALGLAQLPKQQEFLSRRLANRRLLMDMLAEFEPIGGSYAIAVRVPEPYGRDSVRHQMLSKRVETSVYYPRPVPRHPYYRDKYGDVACPTADSICSRTVAVSVGPHLTADHMALTARVFRESLVKEHRSVRVVGDSAVTDHRRKHADRTYRRGRIYRPPSRAKAS